MVEAEELYTGFRQELLYYCTALAHNGITGEDLVQETYLRALSHLGELQDLSRQQWRSWLYQTAKHLYIDQLRKAAREQPAEEEQLERCAFEEDLTRGTVEQLIGRLPESERALFAMRYFQGYNATELGEIFDLPSSTVRARLLSARQRLRQWLAE